MNKALVLGSSGQIGSNLVSHLLINNWTVYSFDLINSPNEDLRIENNILLEDYIKRCDIVFFLAFDVGGSRYLEQFQNTFNFIDNNMSIMHNTFNMLRIYNKPFIFASSQMSSMSYSSYGTLKAIGEYYTKSLNGLFVRLWNVYGIEHDINKSHVITDFIISAKTKNEIRMITDGQEERQMLYANDCSKCLETLAIQYKDISRKELLHISSFEWIKIINIAEIISSKINKVPIIVSKQKDNIQLNLRNEPSTNILKFWKPSTSIEDGIQQIINSMSTS